MNRPAESSDWPPEGSPAAPPPLIPYASPNPLAQAGELFRDHELLIVRSGSTLPSHCILCGMLASDGPVRLHFTWDASFTFSRRAPTLQLRQKGHVLAYLCTVHRKRWRWGRILGIGGSTAALLLMGAGMTISVVSEMSTIPVDTPFGLELTIGGFALMILSLFFFTLRTRTLSCVRIDAGYLHLEGATAVFLQPLPQAPPRAGEP